MINPAFEPSPALELVDGGVRAVHIRRSEIISQKHIRSLLSACPDHALSGYPKTVQREFTRAQINPTTICTWAADPEGNRRAIRNAVYNAAVKISLRNLHSPSWD